MDHREIVYFLTFMVAASVFLFSVPAADFPLADDVIYFESVRNFVENGSLTNNQPYIATLVTQILYGSLFAFVLGLSYETLMISMMVAGVIVVGCTYLLLRTKLDVKYSILGSSVLLTSPIFFMLTHTFMTDIFALIFVCSSIFMFVRFVGTRSYSYLLAGIALVVAGFWVRQYVLMTAGGLFMYLVLKDRKTLMQLKVLLTLIVIPTISAGLWAAWFYGVHDQSYVCPYTLGFTSNLVKNLAEFFIYSGYFLLPFGALAMLNFKKILFWLHDLRGVKKYLPFVVVVMMVGFILVRGYVGVDFNPFDDSLAKPEGLGAHTISGDKQPLFPLEVWPAIIVLSLFTAFSMTAILLRKIKEDPLWIIMVAAMTIPPLFFVAFHERYYLFIIPLALPILLSSLKGFRHVDKVLVASIIMMAAWSWYGTYDYLAWNTARWEGIDHLLATGVGEREIDGGLEYDARFFEKCTNRSAAVNWHGWGYSVSDEYVVSFSRLEGYETLEEIGYLGPFGEKLGSIFVERKLHQPI